jgi:hypothetical protein
MTNNNNTSKRNTKEYMGEARKKAIAIFETGTYKISDMVTSLGVSAGSLRRWERKMKGGNAKKDSHKIFHDAVDTILDTYETLYEENENNKKELADLRTKIKDLIG